MPLWPSPRKERNSPSAMRLAFLEEFMADNGNIVGGRDGTGGWSLAAALGLLAVAFLVDRLAPAENEASKMEASRNASAAGLMAEGKDRDRSATTPSEIPARGWKDILLRVYANVSDHRILALAAG